MRDVYWKVYNTLYISAQDSLVAAYPKVKDDGKNVYNRYELDYFLWKRIVFNTITCVIINPE